MNQKQIQIGLCIGALTPTVVAAFYLPPGWVPILFLTVGLFWGLASIFPEYWGHTAFWLIMLCALVGHAGFVYFILRPPVQMNWVGQILTASTEAFFVILAVVVWASSMGEAPHRKKVVTRIVQARTMAGAGRNKS